MQHKGNSRLSPFAQFAPVKSVNHELTPMNTKFFSHKKAQRAQKGIQPWITPICADIESRLLAPSSMLCAVLHLSSVLRLLSSVLFDVGCSMFDVRCSRSNHWPTRRPRPYTSILECGSPLPLSLTPIANDFTIRFATIYGDSGRFENAFCWTFFTLPDAGIILGQKQKPAAKPSLLSKPASVLFPPPLILIPIPLAFLEYTAILWGLPEALLPFRHGESSSDDDLKPGGRERSVRNATARRVNHHAK
jgi:hypothetical protein